MSTAGTVLSIALAIAFLGAGGTKVANLGPHEKEFVRYRLPGLPAQLARVLVGSLEVTAAALLAIAAITDSRVVAIVGAAVVIVAMAGALGTHVRIKDPAAKMIPPVVLGLAAVALVVFA